MAAKKKKQESEDKSVALSKVQAFLRRMDETISLIFIDSRTLLIVLLILTLNLIIFLPQKVGIHFPSVEVEIYILESILRTITIFIGVMFSFILLSFNTFSRYFGRFAFAGFFKSRGIRILFSLFFSAIILITYALAYLKELDSTNSYAKSLLITSVLLSLATVFSIFPVMVKLLRKSQNRNNIHDIVSQLDLDWVINSSQDFTGRQVNQDYVNPISLLLEIGTISIKEFDQITLRTILDSIYKRLGRSIESKDDPVTPLELYNEFRELISGLVHIALKERNEGALISMIQTRCDMEEIMVLNLERTKLQDHNSKYFGWSFDMDIETMYNRTIQFNEDEVCRRIIDHYRNHISRIINVIFPERKFDFDRKNPLSAANNDEQSLLWHVFRNVEKMLGGLLEAKKYHLFQNVSNLYSTLELTAVSSSNTDNTTWLILRSISLSKVDSFEKYIKNRGNGSLPYLHFPFHSSNTKFVDTPLLSALQAIDILFANDQLNSMALNSIKAFALSFINDFSSDISANKRRIMQVVNKLDQIRLFITPQDSDLKKENYLQLHQYLSIIYAYAAERIPEETDFLQQIKEVSARFVHTLDFQKELEGKGYLFNNNIV